MPPHPRLRLVLPVEESPASPRWITSCSQNQTLPSKTLIQTMMIGIWSRPQVEKKLTARIRTRMAVACSLEVSWIATGWQSSARLRLRIVRDLLLSPGSPSTLSGPHCRMTLARHPHLKGRDVVVHQVSAFARALTSSCERSHHQYRSLLPQRPPRVVTCRLPLTRVKPQHRC